MKYLLFYSTVAQQVDMCSPQNTCKLPGCSRAAHPGYECCSLSHGRAYKGLQEQSVVPCTRPLGAGAGGALVADNGGLYVHVVLWY